MEVGGRGTGSLSVASRYEHTRTAIQYQPSVVMGLTKPLSVVGQSHSLCLHIAPDSRESVATFVAGWGLVGEGAGLPWSLGR